MNASVPGSCYQGPPHLPFPTPVPPQAAPAPKVPCAFIVLRVKRMADSGAFQGEDLETLYWALNLLTNVPGVERTCQIVLERLRGMLKNERLARRDKNTLMLAIARIRFMRRDY